MTIGTGLHDPAITNGQHTKSPSSKTDALIDSALDFLSTEKPSNDNAQVEREPGKKKPAEPRRPDENEPDGDAEQEVPGEDDAGAEDPEDRGDGEEADESEHGTKGSKEDPYAVKDLPKDKFISLKVDGEKTVVSLAELADGYIRERTFSTRINKTKQMADQAQELAQKAVEYPKRLREEFQSFVTDPDQIYEFFLGSEEREQTFARAAERYAHLLRRFRERPEERLAFQRQRDQERLAKERETWEAQKREEQTARQRAEANERALKIFKPGWDEGLRRAGFPQPTKELYDEVMIRCNQLVARGGTVEPDDVAKFVERAAKLLELPKAGDKKPKAPPPAAPKERRQARDQKWGEVPRKERAKSVDYWISGLSARDFRR
jgi:hypothetical protein